MAAARKIIKLPKFRGAPLEFLKCHDHEVILCGPADTSKTWAGCVKSFMLCADKNRSGIHGCMVRKTFNSIESSCGRTFKSVTQGMPIRRVGGVVYTDKWIFPNGSELMPVGMDKPDRMLSSEFDFVHVVQAEQLTESDWEIIGSRCTGRGAKVAYPQIFGDCNPAGSRHWIRARAAAGNLTLLNAVHKDNPALYDDTGNITTEGIKRIGMLESSLSGVRRKRLLEGLWATAEGAVYDMFNSTLDGPHVRVRQRKEMKRFFLAMDDGYTNPAVILDIGEDADGRWHCFREFYQRGQPRETVVATALAWHKEFNREVVAVDNAVPELIAQLVRAGMNAVGGKGKVEDGCQVIRDKLKVAGDGLARYTVDPSCENHINEFESYVMNPATGVPIKEFDHSLDGLRYLADVLKLGTITAESLRGLKPDENSGGVWNTRPWQTRHWTGAR